MSKFKLARVKGPPLENHPDGNINFSVDLLTELLRSGLGDASPSALL